MSKPCIQQQEQTVQAASWLAIAQPVLGLTHLGPSLAMYGTPLMLTQAAQLICCPGLGPAVARMHLSVSSCQAMTGGPLSETSNNLRCNQAKGRQASAPAAACTQRASWCCRRGSRSGMRGCCTGAGPHHSPLPLLWTPQPQTHCHWAAWPAMGTCTKHGLRHDLVHDLSLG